MERIATSQTYSSALLGLGQAQDRVTVAAQQISSGKIADDLKGYASSARTLTAAQAVKSRIDTYLATGASLSDRLSAQSDALGAVADSANGAHKAVMDSLASGDGSTLMQALQGWFSQASNALNTDYQGSYLFSGGKGDVAPVDTGTLTDLTTGGAASHFQNGSFSGFDRLDDDVTVQTGFTASSVGGPFFAALQNIVAQNAVTPFTNSLTTAQQAFLTSQLQPLQDAAGGVQAQVASNGVTEQRVSTITASLTHRQTAAAGVLSNITDADPAQAVTNLQLAQTALQASAQVFQSLTSSSLLNILK